MLTGKMLRIEYIRLHSSHAGALSFLVQQHDGFSNYFRRDPSQNLGVARTKVILFCVALEARLVASPSTGFQEHAGLAPARLKIHCAEKHNLFIADPLNNTDRRRRHRRCPKCPASIMTEGPSSPKTPEASGERIPPDAPDPAEENAAPLCESLEFQLQLHCPQARSLALQNPSRRRRRSKARTRVPTSYLCRKFSGYARDNPRKWRSTVRRRSQLPKSIAPLSVTQYLPVTEIIVPTIKPRPNPPLAGQSMIVSRC